MNKKKILLILGVTKIPIIIYIAWLIIFVPQIDAVITDTNITYIQGAHRGASLDFTENTLEAFQKALEEDKYKFIEFDITYTKNKKIVVIHQNNNYRRPKKGVIHDMTYDEVQEAFGYKVPLYHEVMNLIAGKKPLEIEIKTHGDIETGKQLVDYVVTDLKERGILNQIMITSPTEEIVSYVEENYPEIKTGRVYFITTYSILPLESTTQEFYNDSQADYILLHGYNLENIENLTELKPKDKTLMIWYFTDEVYILQDEGEENRFWDN